MLLLHSVGDQVLDMAHHGLVFSVGVAFGFAALVWAFARR